jgi:hypothetical protein
MRQRRDVEVGLMRARGRRLGLLALALALPLGAGCKRGAPPAAPAPDAHAAGPPASAALPARPAGMEDPFARMTADSVKALNTGYAALRAHKPDDARAAFASVVAALPDHTAARFQQLRASALAGQLAEAPELWAELLARDFVAYAGKLDKAKDMAALRAAPEWQRLRAVESAARAAYAAGLGRGVFFIARTRAAAPARVGPGGPVELTLNQEVFHYDHGTGRYRRLTDTGGHVFAFEVAPTRKTLAFLVTPTVAPMLNGEAAFRDAKAGSIDLTSLETTGPAPFGPAGLLASQVTVCVTGQGEPVWRVTDGQGETAEYAFDATGAALVRAAAPACVPDSGTAASVDGVRHLGPPDGRARLAPAGDMMEIDGADKPIRLARPVEPTSMSWAPAGKRLAYAGVLDVCAGAAAADGAAAKRKGKSKDRDKDKAARNELFLWDKDKPRPARIAAAVSYFASKWLDDDHLLYEGGVDGAARLMVYDAITNVSTPLKPRSGGGLYGVPTLACPQDAEHDVPADEPQAEAEQGGPSE